MSDHEKVEDVHKRLKMLLVSMFRENEGERANAAGAFYRYLIANKIHAQDIDLFVGGNLIARNQAVIKQLLADNQRVHNENLYLRRHVGATILRDAIRARQVDYQWFDLEDLARAKFGTVKGELPRHWRGTVMKLANTTPYQLQRWELGVVRIPDQVFTAIQALPDYQPPTPKEKRSAKPAKINGTQPANGRETMTWTPEAYRLAVSMCLKGVSGPEIAKHFGTNEGSFWSKFKNRAPDETLLGTPITIRHDGPMDVLELWKLGHNLHGAGWRATFEDRFKLGGRKIQYNPPDQILTPDQIQVLRQEWHVWHAQVKTDRKTLYAEEYRVFEELALELAKEPDHAERIAWMKVFYVMRDRGVELPNDVGPRFAARFNAERFEFFDIRKKTRAAYQSGR